MARASLQILEEDDAVFIVPRSDGLQSSVSELQSSNREHRRLTLHIAVKSPCDGIKPGTWDVHIRQVSLFEKHVPDTCQISLRCIERAE